jgi:hypothetical protein
VHGHDGDDLDVGHAENLIGLVGRPPQLAQGGDEEVAAVPQQPIGVQPEPPAVLLGVDHDHPAGADDQVVDVGLGAGDGQVVQDRPAAPLQGA